MIDRARRPRPVVLCIIDGLGERAERTGNAVALAATPALDALRARSPHTLLGASGPHVGLPAGRPGDCQVGHLVLGAGRVVRTDRDRIDLTLGESHLGRVLMLDQTVRICLYDGCCLHLLGLLSDGGGHAALAHLFALIDLASFHEIPLVVHAFLDGRDVPPRSALGYLDRLQAHLEGKDATIGSLSGRYWAMDRDGRWDRTYQAFHAIVRDRVLGPAALRAETAFEALRSAYARGESDELLTPVRIGDYEGLRGDFVCDFAAAAPVWEWTGEDCGVAFNCRGDGMRQLTRMLTRQQLPDEVARDLLMDRRHPVRAFRPHCYLTLTSHAEGLESVPVAFPPAVVPETLGEVVAAAGLRQLRCGETESADRLTRFLGGGREEPLVGETRVLVPSPRLVDTYEHQPEMSAAKVTARARAAIEQDEADLVVVGYANPDAVGHRGDLGAAIAAVEAVDAAVGELGAAAERVGGALVVTSDHGNCEMMLDEAGKPHCGHTANPVPLLYLSPADPDARLRDGGNLADVAPTVLELLGLERPASMTGRSLRRAR
jgi:2,3-bisphosphoglycerate-independent phosphoglycerate mutase